MLQKNLDNLLASIEKARLSFSKHHIVQLVAVSKYSQTDAIETLFEYGQRAFGENQVQQLKSRAEALKNLPISWHMLGRIQTNKINNIIDLSPTLVHSIDSLKLAQEFEKKLSSKGKTQRALLQINSANEATKAGVDPQKAIELFEQITSECSHLRLEGVMTIGAHSVKESEITKSFEKTREIFEEVNKRYGATICSMGMSGDYRLAIKSGANLIRVGSTLFN